ncbi:MAG: hypothetical protein ACFCUO_01010 [Rhodospirillales bacterium]
MLHVDIPTLPELRTLAAERGDICASLYLPTSPVTPDAEADRILLKNLARAAIDQLTAAGADKRQILLLDEQFADVVDDVVFWKYQAHSLAVLATPDRVRTFRLPNRLTEVVEVADRFHLKPLLRAVTFPHEAFVLALSENGTRLIEVTADLPPTPVAVDGMPTDAASAVGRASLNDRSAKRRLQGAEGKKVLLRQYARQVDGAMRALLAGAETPLILAAAEPIASIYRSVNSYPHLTAAAVPGSPDKTPDHELARAARPILDDLYATAIDGLKELFAQRDRQRRATTDAAAAARAATLGIVDTLLVDMDRVVPGTVDDDGTVTLVGAAGASSYGVVDEIARRALLTGARVLSVRGEDLPADAPLAAILRTPLPPP